MKNYSSFVMNKLLEEPFNVFAMIYLDFRNLKLYATTTPDDIEFNGNIYLSSYTLLDYTAPIQSAVVDRQNFNINFGDTSGYLKSKISKSEAGRAAEIYFGFFNDDGTPNLETGNVITAYSGYIDNTEYSNDFEEAILTVGLSSPMSDLGLVKTMITSPQGMDQFNLLDTSFDRILEDNEEALKWGKI